MTSVHSPGAERSRPVIGLFDFPRPVGDAEAWCGELLEFERASVA
jgi:hypothetical protein